MPSPRRAAIGHGRAHTVTGVLLEQLVDTSSPVLPATAKNALLRVVITVTGRDHRAIAMLSLDAWIRLNRRFPLYFYEVSDGEDTAMFSPTDYVDIGPVEPRKRAACYAHASQEPDKWYPHQVELTRFRGSMSGYPQAEGFLRHWQSRSALLP